MLYEYLKSNSKGSFIAAGLLAAYPGTRVAIKNGIKAVCPSNIADSVKNRKGFGLINIEKDSVCDDVTRPLLHLTQHPGIEKQNKLDDFKSLTESYIKFI